MKRFEDFRSVLEREGIRNIAIAVKARPDSITRMKKDVDFLMPLRRCTV
jgi:hypothetical protein